MNVGRLARLLGYSMIGALVVAGVLPARAFAQSAHQHSASQPAFNTSDRSGASALVQIVREATERYKKVSVAQKAGYPVAVDRWREPALLAIDQLRS